MSLIDVGYDIIDAHGLFTFLNHPVAIELRGTRQLFSGDQMEQAEAIQELAGCIAPEHSPYAMVEVKLRKG